MTTPSSSSPKIGINPITKILDALAGFVSSRILAKIKRDDRGIVILSRLHLIPDNPEPDFDSVYAYSIAAHGRGKPAAVKRLFRHKFIKSAFKQAFEQRDPAIIRNEVESLSEWSPIGEEFHSMDYDPRSEIKAFAEIFYQMVQLTRAPAEVVRDQKLEAIKDKVAEVRYQLIELENRSRGELVLSLDWFKYRFRKQLAGVGDKYIPELHTPTNIGDRIHALLGDDAFVEILQDQFSNLEEDYRLYCQAADELNGPFPGQIDWNDSKDPVIEAAHHLRGVLEATLSTIKECHEAINLFQLDFIRQVSWSAVLSDLDRACKDYAQIIADIDITSLTYKGNESTRKYLLDELTNKLHRPKWKAEDFFNNLNEIIEQMKYLNQTYLHLLGSAGIGKTHLAAFICQNRIEKGQPTILVLGRHFSTEQPITEQIKSILDVPQRYSWQDLLAALSTFAKEHRTRMPIIIDGLNEATYQGMFSNVWRNGLPGFITELNSYDDLVLITTCRTSYKEEIWPNGDDPNIISMYGFDSISVDNAIEKYFDYYNIKADLTDAPLSQFEHPIYLRIFCESKNPVRQEEIEVYIGEETVFEVFDEFLNQANQRVVEQTGRHRRVNLLLPALIEAAGYLWKKRSRGIPLRELVRIIDGSPLERLDWQMSTTRAIESEGLLVYRDWFEEDETIYFAHDLLAGYLIAQSLLTQGDSNLEEYLNSDEITSLLFSEDYEKLHPLYEDIRHTLAVLLPVRTRRYLHEFIDNEEAFSISIEALFEIPPPAINEEAVSLIIRLFDYPENRIIFLQNLASTMRHINHPFNAHFLTDRLISLTMPDRDICWTEHIREDMERFESTISRFENDCKNNIEFSRIAEQRLCLVAEYVTWALTSTVRPLRDRATRALYWFGRRFPGEFLDLLRKSLDINDPYVSERMLAATYGMAMARQYDFQDPNFAQEYLPEYGRLIYDMMFSTEAAHATSHILARDYARRTIEIALIHKPGLLNPEEQERIKPPFIDGGIGEWGQSEHGKDGRLVNPIRMDFGNYTIGRLIKGRSNYDSEHEGYREVLSNIYWRINNLGYRTELFERADEIIDFENQRRGRHDNRGKTDRYGKKYSWIAFYEMAGHRQDQGLLNDLYGAERISDADIDPSFPDNAPDYTLITSDFLGDRTASTEEWILNGGLPDLSPYLVIEDLNDQYGPWVLLDGYINQEDPTVGRKRFIFPRGFFVNAKFSDNLVERLENQDLAGRWLPEIPRDYYLYAGEIPWADTYPYNGLEEIGFIIGHQIVDDIDEKIVLTRDGEPQSDKIWSEVLQQAIRRANELDTNHLDAIVKRLAEEMGFEVVVVKEPVKRKMPFYEKIKVLVPTREYTWESYHSDVNQTNLTSTLAKEIAENLDLCGQPQTFDLFEKSGKRATIALRHGNHWHTYQSLIYLRKELLDRYLGETENELVWAIWGERGSMTEDMPGADDDRVRYKVFQQIIRYEP